MKPLLHLVGDHDCANASRIDAPIAETGRPLLPLEMENRADARELRAFMNSFQRIRNSDDRQKIMDAVRRAAECET